MVAGTLALAALAGVGAPAAYSAEVVATAHTGASPSADPASESRSRTSPATGGFAAFFGGTGPTSSSLDRLLQGAGTRWSAAVSRSSAAAGLELSSRTPVMAIGGFTGSDPAPTLQQFERDVASGQVRYYLLASSSGRSAGSSFGSGGETGTIQRWVQEHYRARHVGGYLVYDLSASRSTGGGTGVVSA